MSVELQNVAVNVLIIPKCFAILFHVLKQVLIFVLKVAILDIFIIMLHVMLALKVA